MRHNGWQLPCHPLQVCAVAVSLALVFALYIFFLPLVNSTVMRMFIITVHSPMATTVFLLYVWCVASDPADCRVKSSKKYRFPSSCSNGNQNQNKENGHANPSDETADKCLCMHTKKSDMELHLSEAELIFCSLCCVEVSKNSKHCGTCDKCVEDFDHHCVWLNNCIGRRNYKAFFLLVALGLFMFILQSSLGIWIMVKCFLNKGHFVQVIASKLGKSFSFNVYVFVVVLCTILPMLATYFLSLLTCFHLILIKKGITTYEYVIASTIKAALLDKENLQIGPNSIVKDQAEHSIDHDKTTTDQPILKQINDSAVSQTPEHSILKKKLSVKISPCILASMSRYDIEMALNKSDASSTVLGAVQSSRNSNVDVGSSSFGSKYVCADSVVSMGFRSGSSNRFDINLDILDQAIASGWSVDKLSLDSSGQIDSSENNSGNLTRDKALSPLQREAREVFRRSHAFSDFGLIPGFKTC